MVNQKGVSLVESLLVMAVLGSIIFLISSIPNSLQLIAKARRNSLAREIAVKQIEDKRTVNYENLVSDSFEITDSRLSLLPGGKGNLTVADCDPKLCLNGEHIKEVTVTIDWTENNKNQEAVIKTMIGEGGINQ